MLDTFTMETFQPHVGQTFRVVVDDQWELRVRLTEVHAWGGKGAENRPRTPFSLLFHGPADPAALPQQIYRVESDVMDPFELFLVPLGPDEQGMQYEAVFT